MALPAATVNATSAQQRLTVAALVALRRAWAQMGPDFTPSWRRVGPMLVVILAGAQLRSARNGAEYVPAVLEETGQGAESVAIVEARRFSGVASDGRRLDDLLFGAVTTARAAVGAGSDFRVGLRRGESWLAMAAATQVSDAFRGGTLTAMAARPAVSGYVRALQTPSCARCAILAGRWYRMADAFDRHPRCDCKHLPVAEADAGPYVTSPRAAYEAGQIDGLTEGERAALDAGGDMSRIVNARRGASGLRGLTTTELRGRGRRLTPEGILRTARSREHAIELLTTHGYLR